MRLTSTAATVVDFTVLNDPGPVIVLVFSAAVNCKPVARKVVPSNFAIWRSTTSEPASAGADIVAGTSVIVKLNLSLVFAPKLVMG